MLNIRVRIHAITAPLRQITNERRSTILLESTVAVTLPAPPLPWLGVYVPTWPRIQFLETPLTRSKFQRSGNHILQAKKECSSRSRSSRIFARTVRLIPQALDPGQHLAEFLFILVFQCLVRFRLKPRQFGDRVAPASAANSVGLFQCGIVNSRNASMRSFFLHRMLTDWS
jgi:hypothetical protein